MASFKDQLAPLLKERGIDVEAFADQLVCVMKGESIKDTYNVDKESGELKLVRRSITRTAGDMQAGLALMDSFASEPLGISEHRPAVRQRKIKKINGDSRIVASSSDGFKPIRTELLGVKNET